MVKLPFKILIADDDEGMRLILSKAISKIEGFEQAGEAADGESAFRLACELKPDIIFLDVEMPGLSGIECAQKVLDFNPKTIIIFATAHEEYMPDAFRLYAFDYLVKPFRLERVKQTLDRIRDLKLKPEDGDYPQPQKSISVKKPIDKLIIRNKESVNFVDVADIILIQREEGNSVIYTKDGRYVTSDGLSELEERLDGALFYRCHKSYIINLTTIIKIYPYGRWTYIVKLKGTDRDALMTHEKFEELETKFR